MTVGRRGHHLRLVLHQLERARQHHVARLGQRHGRRGAVADLLERAEQRPEQLPAGEPAGLATVLRAGREVGHEEGVGQLAGQHGLRHDAPLGDSRQLGGVDRLVLLDLDAGALEHRPAHVGGLVGDLRVLGEEGEQRRLAGGGLGQDRGDPVEPLELAVALGLGQSGVGADADAFLTRQQGHSLEPRPHGHGLTALHGGLDLAHGARQDRDDSLVVEGARAPLTASVRTARGLALTAPSHWSPPTGPDCRRTGSHEGCIPPRTAARRASALELRPPGRETVGRPGRPTDEDRGLRSDPVRPPAYPAPPPVS